MNGEGRSSSSSNLSVSKASKIGKGVRRPALQPLTVYKTGPEGFRGLVQELTGAASSSSEVAPTKLPVTNVNIRLHNLAPPPLMPPPNIMFSSASTAPPNPLSPLLSPHRLTSASPTSISLHHHHQQQQQQRLMTPLLSPLSSSPMPTLASNDNIYWANHGIDSPISANMRELAHQLVAAQSQQQQHQSQPSSPTFAAQQQQQEQQTIIQSPNQHDFTFAAAL